MFMFQIPDQTLPFIIGWFIGILLGFFLLSQAFKMLPLANERILLKFAFPVLFAGAFCFFGIPVTIAFAAILVFIVLSNAKKSGKPIIPQFSLAELLAMVLSISFAPIAFSQLYLENVTVHAGLLIAIAAGLFPIAFLRAFHRLDANKVPYGWTRPIYIGLFPYMVYSGLFFCARGTAMVSVMMFSAYDESFKPLVALPQRLMISALVFGTGIVVSNYARAEAKS